MCKSGAYHMQGVVRHIVLRNSSAIKFDRVEIAFLCSFILLAELFTDEGGEETTPDDELKKMSQTKARKFKPQPRLEPAL